MFTCSSLHNNRSTRHLGG